MVRGRTKSSVPDDTQPECCASASNTGTDLVGSEREILVQDRQNELGRALSRHDDLIREQFQLENYGLMLQYDPEVAKEDQTNEFLRFKDRHDLMKYVPSAGPSRATRHSQTVRISALAQFPRHSISTAAAPVSSAGAIKRGEPSPRISAVSKGKQKETVTTVTATESMDGARVGAKSRGKRKAVDECLVSRSISDRGQDMESVSSLRIGSKPRARPKAFHDFTRESSRTSHSQSTLTDDTLSTPPVVSGRSTRNSLRDASASVSRPVKKRRLLDEEHGIQQQLRIMIPPTPARHSSPCSTSRPVTSGKSLPGKTLPSNAAPRPIIRRIKLIVRPPTRSISSPRQRPNAALFGYSLPALLASYVEIDGKSYSAAGLEAAAWHDARVLNRLEALKRKGRFPGWRLTDNSTSAPVHYASDIWANVVADAIAVRNALPRHRFGRGGALAAAVHTRLHAHWELMKKDLEREQVLEERRLRALAKSILRLVLSEWKKAVFHLREQARLAHEAEEARRGRQHLDAILDQSGQILEKQQLELVRADSVSADGDEEEREGEDGEEEATDIDDIDDEDDGREPSEVMTEVDEGEGGVTLDQDRESYIDFNVPLNDVTLGEDEVPSKVVVQDVSARRSEAGVNEEEDDESSATDSEEAGAIADIGDMQGGLDVDREVILGHDDDERPLSDTDMASSKASHESTPFMDDIHVRDEKLLRVDIGLSSVSESIHAPDIPNGLEHESIIMPSKSIAGEFPDPMSAPSKLPILSSIAVDCVENASLIEAPSATLMDSSTQSKLLNGHSSHLNHTSAVVTPSDVRLSVGDVEEALPKASAFASVQVERDVESNVALDPVDSGSSLGHDNKEQQTERVPGNIVAEAENQDAKKADDVVESEPESEWEAPVELQPYAVAHVEWEPGSKVVPPLLLRGTLRPYQQSGLEWLASLHNNETNGILADEMGLGKTIQTIALLAHLACDRGIWGPHLIIVPTSVLLNWEMEFKKFLPGFNILSYHGSTKRRKELRQGWNNKHAFNVCVTSYTLASRDQHIFKRKAWYYMILDEAHMIKNFKSQRWNILLMFRSFRRLLLTGTPLQNNLTELWALLRFLMSGTNFANQKEFSEWFGIPLEKAIELGNVQDQEVQLQVTKLHEMLRPFLLRRMKKDVEKELPRKYEHLVLCRLSKRQRFLYDEFMSRSQTREDLKSGVYQKIANILMQLRKVCNHPDLFEVRPIVTSFAMDKSAIVDFEIKELLVRRRLLEDDDRSSRANLGVVGLQFTHHSNTSLHASQATRSLEELLAAELIASSPGEPPPRDLRTIEGYRSFDAYQRRLSTFLRYQHMVYLNRLRCRRHVLYGLETINIVKRLYNPLTTACEAEILSEYRPANVFVKSYVARAEQVADMIDKFAFATPAIVAPDIPSITLREIPGDLVESLPLDFDAVLHSPSVKLQIAFPDVSLLQYDCGKLQELARLLLERKSGGHRVLIFTQMTRILDILEMFLNFHGYLYLRLDGATKIEDRQYITERFNADSRIFAFIASSRSGGVGINLTGADTVIFYDSDFNPQMDRQCEDRAHRIGQIRDVHIYRFISQYTVEEAMLRKANQKRSLDDLVIQKGDFDWKNFFRSDEDGPSTNASALQKALVEFEDFEDVEAAKVAAREEARLEGEDRAEFGDGDGASAETPTVSFNAETSTPVDEYVEGDAAAEEEEEEEGGAAIDYMIKFVRSDPEFFQEWKVS